jgi:hypothetical protein
MEYIKIDGQEFEKLKKNPHVNFASLFIPNKKSNFELRYLNYFVSELLGVSYNLENEFLKRGSIPVIFWENPTRIKPYEDVLKRCGTSWLENWSENLNYIEALKLAEKQGNIFMFFHKKTSICDREFERADAVRITKSELRELRKKDDPEYYSKWKLI